MKLNRITVEGYQKITNIDIERRAPIIFVAGHNEAGKTSLADAIRHAFLGEAGRVKLKKDFGDLVNDDFKKGVVSLEWERNGAIGGASVVIPAGTRTIDMEPTAAHHCMMDFRRFTSLAVNERRGLLFGLGKIRVTGAVIRGKLLESGANPAKTESIAPILLAGFEAAEKEAKSKVSEARGAWKATTGEAYGAVKAESWKAVQPEWSKDKIEELTALQSMASDLVNQANVDLGAMTQKKRSADQAAVQINALREKAGMLERITTKKATDEAALAEWTAKVDDTRSKATGAKHIDTLDCPHCAGVVVLEKGKLAQYVAPTNVADPEAVMAFPEHEKALARVQSWVDNDIRDLNEAMAAKASLAELDANPVEVIGEDALETERKRVKQLEASAADARKNLDAEIDRKSEAMSAVAKTDKAAGYHQDTKDWDAIASLLAPSGIQSQMTTEAMTPIRERLKATAEATGWAAVTIDDDMSVRIGGRPYGLGSQSAKWRADVAITEAIATLSGERFYMIDEFDVLDMNHRGTFLKWMNGLAKSGQIDTAIVLGTMKEAPAGWPAAFQVEWVQDGALRVALMAAA